MLRSAMLAGARASGEAFSFSLKAVARAARPRGVALRGHFLGFAFTADFLARFFALLPARFTRRGGRTLLAREEFRSPRTDLSL